MLNSDSRKKIIAHFSLNQAAVFTGIDVTAFIK